jgi:hypothetical protein
VVPTTGEDGTWTLDTAGMDPCGYVIHDWQNLGIDPVAWAWESHEAAAETAYGALPKHIAFEPDVKVKECTENNEIGKRMCKKRIRLGDDYKDAAVGVIEERLAQAAIRLAMILNDAVK